MGRWHLWQALALASLLLTSTAAANGRDDYLVRLLRESPAFRVRAQAALSLGQLEPTRPSLEALERAVRETGGDANEAARRLGIGRSTLYRKLAKHGIAARRSSAGVSEAAENERPLGAPQPIR